MSFFNDPMGRRLEREAYKFFEKMNTDDAERVLAYIFKRIRKKILSRNDVVHREVNTIPNNLKTTLDIGLDHPGIIRERKKALCSTYEPYGISMDKIKNLITHCEKKDLHFYISGHSPHFVGRTVLIKVFKNLKNNN